MKLGNLLFSVAIHAAVIGALWVSHRVIIAPVRPDVSIPISFELMTEVHETVAEGSPAEAEAEAAVPEGSSVEPMTASPVAAEPFVANPAEPMAETGLESAEEPPGEPLADSDSPRPQDDIAIAQPEKDQSSEAAEKEAADEERAKVVSEPKPLGRISPRYPRSARKRKREGAVTVGFRVMPGGGVEAAEVLVSSGCRELDESALESVRRAAFAPATEDGVPIPADIRLTFEFRLR